MKFDAHPLAVAVALGLLGPGVLEVPAAASDGECEDDRDDAEVSDETTRVEYEPGPAPDPDAFHRVEIEWLKTQG